MCRSNAEGGRRCIAHSDPARIAEYNAERRKQYAHEKLEQAAASEFDMSRTRVAPTGKAMAYHKQQTAKFEAAITPEEQDALIDYTEFEYEDIRDYLTGYHVKFGQPKDGLSFDDDRLAEIKERVELLDSALAKSENKKPRKLYRGMRINRNVPDPSAWVQQTFKPGVEFSQQGYMSTSLSPFKAAEFGDSIMDDGSRSIIFEIVSSKGAILGDESSSFGFQENEVLLPRDAKFKVVAVHERAEFKYDYFDDEEDDFGLEDDEPFSVTRTVIQVIDLNE
jgi:hypothetical protein